MCHTIDMKVIFVVNSLKDIKKKITLFAGFDNSVYYVVNSKFEEIFNNVSWSLSNPLSEKMSQIKQETKKIESEIKLIEDAKKDINTLI